MWRFIYPLSHFLSVCGVYRCDIDARSNKVTVAVTGDVSGDALVKRLRRSGKNAEQWPEQQQQPADSTQTPGEIKKQAAEPDKPGGSGTAEKPASRDAEANSAEQSNPKASSEATAGVTETLAQDGTESTSADADGAVEHATKEATAEQCSDAKRNRKEQQAEEEKPSEAMVVVTAPSAQSSDACHLPPPPGAAVGARPELQRGAAERECGLLRRSAGNGSASREGPAVAGAPMQVTPYLSITVR
ncbi:hypothetical protein ACQ4PT_067458 [Festuca glaucescens]